MDGPALWGDRWRTRSKRWQAILTPTSILDSVFQTRTACGICALSKKKKLVTYLFFTAYSRLFTPSLFQVSSLFIITRSDLRASLAGVRNNYKRKDFTRNVGTRNTLLGQNCLLVLQVAFNNELRSSEITVDCIEMFYRSLKTFNKVGSQIVNFET